MPEGLVEGLTLDAGALIAVDRGRRDVLALLELTMRRGGEIHVLPGVLAQAWRDGARQARLGRLLSSPDVTLPTFDASRARRVGELCGITGHSDVVDVHVVLHARLHGHHVVTSDPDDLRRVDPRLWMISV